MPVVLRPTVGLPFLLLGLGVLMAVVVGSGLVFPGPSDAVPELSFSGIPLSFEPNVGQSDESVEFLARGDGYAVFLVDGGATVDMDDGDILRVRLVGSSGSPVAAPSDRLEGAGNYLIGSDSDRWLTGVPHYGRVLYNEVYPGIDLAYYGNRRQLEFDFMVGPAADPHAIRLDFDGAMSLDIDTAGNLIVHASESDFTLLAPFLYQDVDGVKLPVGGGYSLKGPTEVGFLVGAYDRSKTLVIDPVIEYSTYLGGTGLDQANGVAVDTAGNLYVTGNTSSVDFPTQGPLQPALDGTSDAFVLKLSEDGSTLLYSTYIGGRSGDSGIGIAVNTVGEAYVTGHTTSTDFPTAGPLQASNAGGLGDAFVLKLDSTGSALLYSTYLGGNQTDKGNAIAVDQSGNAYVTGFTNGPFPNTFPQVGGFQAGPGGGSFEAFVAKLDPAGSALVYSSFLGGGNTEEGRGIAVDSAGNTYVTGNTTLHQLPLGQRNSTCREPGG